MGAPFSNPKAIAEAAETIYREMYQQDFEQNQPGKFVVINIRTKTATLGDNASDALVKARQADPQGIFHLMRVGFPGAFQLSRYLHSASQDRLIK